MIDPHHQWSTSRKPLILGVVCSLVLTLVAYFVVVNGGYSRSVILGAILGFGLLQVLLQLIFFLHVGMEPRPYWNLMMFLFMALIAFVIVGGSMWIMNNLDYNVMPMMHHS